MERTREQRDRPRYERRVAKRLLPLLRSIGREIQERAKALSRIEPHMQQLAACPRTVSHSAQGLVAIAAEHRRGLSQCQVELKRLGCSIVGTSPLTIRIPVEGGARPRSVVWQTEDRLAG